MPKYELYTLENAPEGSRGPLSRLKDSVGLIPNLAASMAGSPTLIDAFVTLREIYGRGTFTPVEREVISIANAIENDCTYCVAAHSTFATKFGIDPVELSLLRENNEPSDPKTKALRDFARKVTNGRGKVSEADIEEFTHVGYSQAQALEVIVGVAFSIIAAGTFHFTGTPLDDFMQELKWSAAKG